MAIVETEGIITKEIRYGDTSRILTVITRDFGKISILASRVRTNKSGLLAATQLFSCNRFTLFHGREKSLYKMNEAKILVSFSHIRDSLDRMAYASYLCDITNAVVQENASEPRQLDLLKGALYLLDQDKTSYRKVQAVFQFRTLALAGFAPDLTSCSVCGRPDDLTYLNLTAGQAYCSKCGAALKNCVRLNRAILSAIAYICLAEDKKIYAFQMPDSALAYLAALGETAIETLLERKFKTLDYLKKVTALDQ